MKNASNNTQQEQQSRLFKKLGAFFAFSNEQFDSQKKEGVKYVHIAAGLLCPKENVKALITQTEIINTKSIKARLKKFGLDAIIAYELSNHECFDTGVDEYTVNLLSEYGATKEDILRVYNAHKSQPQPQ